MKGYEQRDEKSGRWQMKNDKWKIGMLMAGISFQESA
jgi:hypothetical protein